MASAELSRRVEKVVGYPPLSELSDVQRREFQEALLEADTLEDLPGKWQCGDLGGGAEPAEAAACWAYPKSQGRRPLRRDL
jgi:hypothetical protein